MKRNLLTIGLMLLALGSANSIRTDENPGKSGIFRAKLVGFHEVPALSTPATGEFWMKINDSDTAFDFKLTVADLQTITQSHIHFGQPGVAAGIMIWLCGTATNPGPAGTLPCPAPSGGTVEGTIDASKVVGPAAQGIAASEFAEALKAIRSGVAYANVHSTAFPGGEIRGQIHGRGKSLLAPNGQNDDHDEHDRGNQDKK